MYIESPLAQAADIITVVSKEPTLFGTTIYENIRQGLIGSPFEQDSESRQRDRIVDAAKLADAHNFINDLSDGYGTYVGEHYPGDRNSVSPLLGLLSVILRFFCSTKQLPLLIPNRKKLFKRRLTQHRRVEQLLSLRTGCQQSALSTKSS
jgi:hypothetical protein